MKKVWKWFKKGMKGLLVAMGFLAKWLIISICYLAVVLMVIIIGLIFVLNVIYYGFKGKGILEEQRVKKPDAGHAYHKIRLHALGQNVEKN